MKASIHYYVLVSILFLLISSCSSSSPQNKSLSNNKYIKYYKKIKVAELEILEESYSKAVETYKEAFRIVSPMSLTHCYTATQVSARIGDMESFKLFTKEGFILGLELEDIYKDSIMNSFVKDKKIKKILKESYANTKIIHKDRLNQFLIDTVLKLSNLDNKWKIYYMDSLSHADPKNEALYEKKYDSIVSYIVEDKLIPLIREYGYPGERLIGANWVGVKNSYNRGISQNRALFILIHYYSRPKSCKYNNLLLEQVLNGTLFPKQYTSIIDFQAKYGDSTNCKVNFFNQWHSTKDSSLFKEINQRRFEIGLETIEEIDRKFKRGQKICKEKRNGKHDQIRLFYWCG
ncbi:MAG: hypothetical protein V3U92_15750 [Cellulophaga sp.]